uniref:Zinc knuckle domain-containing protein n=1 Tax=Meloidogyne javanica TaxID=6303 RepID=A0A915LHE2_MELJA
TRVETVIHPQLIEAYVRVRSTRDEKLKITCSACGGIGHMKTNRNCPLYGKEEELASKTVGEICQDTTERMKTMTAEIAHLILERQQQY